MNFKRFQSPKGFWQNICQKKKLVLWNHSYLEHALAMQKLRMTSPCYIFLTAELYIPGSPAASSKLADKLLVHVIEYDVTDQYSPLRQFFGLKRLSGRSPRRRRHDMVVQNLRRAAGNVEEVRGLVFQGNLSTTYSKAVMLSKKIYM